MCPFFIIGTERSGTNLLRVILNAHPDIIIPHPPHIFKNFSKIISNYGDLRVDKNFYRLVKDVIKLVKLHPYQWEIEFDPAKICNHIESRSLIAILFYLYEEYLKKSRRKIFGCKSTFMINYVDQVLDFDTRAKFIYLVRDGRDVAVSAKHSIFNNFHPYYIAQRWKREQQTGIKQLHQLNADQILLIKYEDLLNDIKAQAKKITDFLEVAFFPDMLDYFNTIEAKKGGVLSESWKNTAKPVMTDNHHKFLKQLSSRNILLFEAIAYKELEYFNYTLINKKVDFNQSKISQWKWPYLFSELFSMLIVQCRALIKDKNNFLRYKKWWFVASKKWRFLSE